MQKRVLLSAVLILILLLIPSFWAAESCANEKLDLKLRLKTGQKYGVRLTTELKTSKTIGDKKEHESFMFAKGMGFEVKELEANGVASVKVTYRTLQMKVARAGGYRMEYDSRKQSIADGYSKIPAIEAVCVGEKFEMRVVPEGKIIELKGVEQMHSRMIEKINAWDEKYLKIGFYERHKESFKERRRLNTKSIHSEKEIKNMLSDIIMAFPERPLGIGDSWTDKVKIWGKNYEIEGTYTLKDSKQETVTIGLVGKRTLEEEPFSWVNNEGREVGFKIVGSCQGTFEVDEENGWLIRSEVNMRFTGKVIDEEVNDQMTKPILEQEVIITVEPRV